MLGQLHDLDLQLLRLFVMSSSAAASVPPRVNWD